MQFFRNIPFALIILVFATSLIGAQTPPSGIITTYAGSGITYNCSAFHTAPDCPQIGAYGFKGDGGPATSALLFNPGGIAVDATGNLFMADTNNNRIRKVTRDGVISTVAGNGQPGFSGDGGPATAAELNQPEAVAVDAVGNLFIADWGNHRIRKVIRPAVSVPSEPGLIFTIAGNGQSGFSGDGGPATQASLSTVLGLALDAAGDVFIADTGNTRIREVTPDGLINTVAGNGTFGFSGDGGSATSASLNYPYGIAIDAAGNLLIADHGNNSIRKVTPDGVISSIGVISSDGVGIQQPTTITVDILGNLLVSENERNMVWEVSPAGVAFVVAGGTGGPPAGDGGPAISAALNSPNGVALNAQGDLFIDDSGNSRIRKVTAVAAGGLFLTLEDFVTGLYVNVLGRDPDPGGRSSWVSLSLSPLTGCNAEGFATVAEGFFDDMYSPPLSLTQLVTALYRTFLLRAPDPDGLHGGRMPFARFVSIWCSRDSLHRPSLRVSFPIVLIPSR
jgi:sugar lactone lactonase YvrE